MSRMNSLLLAELAQALRGGRLWGIALRSSIPVFGVYLLGWPATLAVLFYLLEIWMYLSLRASLSLALSDLGKAPGVRPVLAAAGRHFFLVAPLLGGVLAALAWFAVRMVADGWRGLELHLHRWEFAAGTVTLAVMALTEAWQFMRRRIAGTRCVDDDLREMAIVYRAACLMLAGVPVYFLVPAGYDAQVLVFVIALASVWIEGAPRHATRAFGAPQRKRKELFGRRTT